MCCCNMNFMPCLIDESGYVNVYFKTQHEPLNILKYNFKEINVL